MERRSLRRFSFLAALALALLAMASFTATGALAQDDVVVPINELNDSGVSGDASLTDNGDGTTTVDILVDGATGGHPAHIHSGTCAELGDVVYPLTDVDASGESVTIVDSPLADLLTSGPYAINIHLSADEIGTYVACGDIPVEAVGGEVAAAEVDRDGRPGSRGQPGRGGWHLVGDRYRHLRRRHYLHRQHRLPRHGHGGARRALAGRSLRSSPPREPALVALAEHRPQSGRRIRRPLFVCPFRISTITRPAMVETR